MTNSAPRRWGGRSVLFAAYVVIVAIIWHDNAAALMAFVILGLIWMIVVALVRRARQA